MYDSRFIKHILNTIDSYLFNILEITMVQKFKDAASILKAKLKQDDLEESLLQATSEENWQAPTNILHDICNAAYNYEKWQKISDFIWDKLKKKNSWRKILKTLNLVEFIIKNGPPNTVSTFKYELYQFKSLQGFSHYSENTDRGEPIRERAKSIIQLLSNDQLLEEERVKAKTIRERMGNSGSYGSGITGSSISGGGSKYEGYNNQQYKNNQTSNSSYKTSNIPGVGTTAFGDYKIQESTLSKYKSNQEKKKESNNITNQTNSNKNVPDITGMGVSQKKEAVITQENPQVVQDKKPFQGQVKKLRKPGQQPSITEKSKVEQTQVQNTESTKKGGSILDDDDIFGVSSSAPQTAQETSVTNQTGPLINPMHSTTANMAAENVQANNPQSSQSNELNFSSLNLNQASQQTQQNPMMVNPMYGTTAPMAVNNMQNQANQQNPMMVNPMYGTTAPMAVNNMQNQNGQNQQNPMMMNPMYGGTAPTATNNMYNQSNTMNNQWNQPQTMNQSQNWNQQQQNMNWNQPNQNAQSMNWNQPQNTQSQNWNQPQSTQSQNWNQQAPNLNIQPNNGNSGVSMSNSQPNSQAQNKANNVNWLSSEEKGLIDFSDFGSAAVSKKETNTSNASNTGNNIQIDQWNW